MLSTTESMFTNTSQIGEIARIVHYLRKHVVGKTVATVKTQEDDVCPYICSLYKPPTNVRIDRLWKGRHFSFCLPKSDYRKEGCCCPSTRQILLARNGIATTSLDALRHVRMDEILKRRHSILPSYKTRRNRVAAKVLEVCTSNERRARL